MVKTGLPFKFEKKAKKSYRKSCIYIFFKSYKFSIFKELSTKCFYISKKKKLKFLEKLLEIRKLS